jgi:hypothetical protein
VVVHVELFSLILAILSFLIVGQKIPSELKEKLPAIGDDEEAVVISCSYFDFTIIPAA